MKRKKHFKKMFFLLLLVSLVSVFISEFKSSAINVFNEKNIYRESVDKRVKAMVKLYERGMLTYYPVRIHLIR